MEKISETEKEEQTNKKLRKAVIRVGTAVLVLGVLYGSGVYYYKDRFFTKTEINSIACGNLTVQEAEQQIKEKVEDYAIEILFKENRKEVIKGSDIAYTYLPDGTIEASMQAQTPFAWVKGLFSKESYETAENATFDEEKLKKKVLSFASMRDENMREPKDAYIGFENNQFVIKEETAGTVIEKEKLLEKLEEAVKKEIRRLGWRRRESINRLLSQKKMEDYGISRKYGTVVRQLQ